VGVSADPPTASAVARRAVSMNANNDYLATNYEGLSVPFASSVIASGPDAACTFEILSGATTADISTTTSGNTFSAFGTASVTVQAQLACNG